MLEWNGGDMDFDPTIIRRRVMAGLSEIFDSYVDELRKQIKAKGDGRFKYTCADPEAGHALCLAILIEEVGEVAQAVLGYPRNYNEEFAMLARRMATLGEVSRGVLNATRMSNDPNQGVGHKPDRNLKKELTQSAAVITAWLEGMDRKVF